MFKKIFLLALLLIAILGVSSVTYAQTMTEAQRQSLIVQLQAQIAQLTQQINQILLERQNSGIKCTSNWQSGPWNVCTNNQQTRTVTDLNNCVTPTNKPLATQACTVKPINIFVNGSDGPVDIFVTLGNGATTNSTGINLSKSITLQWTGLNVSSCTASDSQNPSIFSGYKTSEGSQTVVLSGNIIGSSSTSKVSDTFKINCVSTINGAQVNDSVVVNLFYTANSNCVPSWQTGTWSACASGKKTRTVTDVNGCGSLAGKPSVTESCTISSCTPSWQLGAWSACANGKETRTVTDANNCGKTTGKPAVSQTCCSATCLTQTDGVYAISCSGIPTKCAAGKTCQPTYSTSTAYVNGAIQTTKTLTGAQCVAVVCNPNWQTSDWSACTNGKKTRAVTDANNCGKTTGKPAISETCCSAECLYQTDGVYTVSCSGAVAKCAAGRTCEKTYSTSYINNNGTAVPVQTLTGAKCICTPNWVVGDWGACNTSGSQARTVTDANNCGTSSNKPVTSQACTVQ